jgi:hypothetical protein
MGHPELTTMQFFGDEKAVVPYSVIPMRCCLNVSVAKALYAFEHNKMPYWHRAGGEPALGCNALIGCLGKEYQKYAQCHPLLCDKWTLGRCYAIIHNSFISEPGPKRQLEIPHNLPDLSMS